MNVVPMAAGLGTAHCCVCYGACHHIGPVMVCAAHSGARPADRQPEARLPDLRCVALMGTTSDRNDPRLTHGADAEPVPMAEVYLVLSDEERAKGFVRPYRTTYVHVGPEGPRFPVRDLTPDEVERFAGRREYVKYEEYPPDDLPTTGRFWTQAQLDAAANGACGTETRMAQAIAETYARSPHFYGATFCVGCSMHRPVGEHGEFVWLDGSRVGT